MAKVIPIVRIVDDDETFCMSQKMFLQAMGWFVLIYNSAKTFLEDDDPSQPGCLILDMRMPEMTGLELQTALVARGAPLPIIFLTGHGDVNMAVHALQHGAFDFLQKPVDPEKLNEVVSRAVEHSIALHEQTRSEEMIRALYDSLTARAGRGEARRHGHEQQGHRREALHFASHGQDAPQQRLHEARRQERP